VKLAFPAAPGRSGEAEPVTEARLAALSGHSQSHINRQLKKLLAIGVIERTAITGPHGRGRAWRLSIKDRPETQALAKALLDGATARAKPRKA
jgi:predicted transcriptional regulator